MASSSLLRATRDADKHRSSTAAGHTCLICARRTGKMDGAGVQCGQTTSDLPRPHTVGAWQVDALLMGCRKASIGPAPTRPGSAILTG
eukprot:355887-Chlamydomonas_euryale.AAC.1